MTLITLIIDLEIKDISSLDAQGYVDGIAESLLSTVKNISEIKSIHVRTIVHEETTKGAAG